MVRGSGWSWWGAVLIVLVALPQDRTTAGREPALKANGQAIEAALDASVTLEFQEAPLSEVVDYLRGACQVPILIDRRALDDVGLSDSTPITVSLNGVSLRSALEVMLREVDLTYTARDDVLQITNPSEAENALRQRVYAIADLMPSPCPSRLMSTPTEQRDLIVDTILAIVAPESWDAVGGVGSIEVYRPWKLLAVSQSAQQHAQISALLEAIRAARRSQGATASDGANHTPVVAVPASQRPAMDRLLEALEADANVEFSEAPLVDVLDFLSEVHRVPTWIDRRALDSVGLNSNAPVTISLRDVPLRTALRRLLAELGLTFTVGNELLVVTTPNEASNQLVTAVYPVRDFLAPPGEAIADANASPTLDDLCQLVTATVQPTSWAEAGGAGNLAALDPWGLLIVAQTTEVHEQLGDFLQALRRSHAEAVDQRAEGSDAAETRATDRVESETPSGVLRLYDLRGLPEDQVRQAIEGALAPGTWGPAPEQGAIFPLSDQLLIRQSPAVHAQIRELLEVLQTRNGG